MLFKNKYGYGVGIVALILSLIGLLFIYSASAYSANLQYGDEFFFLKKQAVALGVGAVAFFAGRNLPIEILRKGKWVILVFSLVLLALVFIPGLGMSSYGATRWITLGFVTFQPSEFSKFGIVLFLSAYLAEKPPTCVKNLIVPVLVTAAGCGMVLAEPNMSITMVVGLSVLALFYAAGMKKKFFVVVLLIVAAGAVGLVAAEPYRIRRLLAFIDPWQNPKGEGYQLIQSFYAVASGGLFGKGIFSGRQKLLFLPFSESDFIFSVIAEETGLFGCAVLLVIFAVFLIMGVRMAMSCYTRYETLLATGITAVTGWQALINFAVVTGMIPPTGVPLPFVSAGGSSLVCFLFFSGVLSGLAARTKARKNS